MKTLKIGELTARIPVIQGGMGVGISLSGLAGSVAACGGVGVISTAQIGYRDPEFEKNPIKTNLRVIGEEIQKAREIAKGGILGVNIMVALKHYRQHIETAVEAGADVITIADPSGTGEILGPRFFKEFAVRYINQLLDGLADLHVETIVHICGHMKNVYKEVNEVHSNALSFDSAVPMMDARKNLADRVLMGNVSTYTLEFGSEEAVRRLAGNCIKCGSDIVSPACGLGMSSPLRNIQALLSRVEESDG